MSGPDQKQRTRERTASAELSWTLEMDEERFTAQIGGGQPEGDGCRFGWLIDDKQPGRPLATVLVVSTMSVYKPEVYEAQGVTRCGVWFRQWGQANEAGRPMFQRVPGKTILAGMLWQRQLSKAN